MVLSISRWIRTLAVNQEIDRMDFVYFVLRIFVALLISLDGGQGKFTYVWFIKIENSNLLIMGAYDSFTRIVPAWEYVTPQEYAQHD